MIRPPAGSVDALVIGGGVVGSTCALRLQEAGMTTLALDVQPPGRPASYGNAGHVALEQAEPLASPAALRSATRRLFGLGGALDFRWRDATVWAPWALRFIAACDPGVALAGTAALGALLGEAGPAWRRLSDELGPPALFVENGHIVVWERAVSAARGLAAWRAADTGPARVRDLTAGERNALAARVRPAVAGGVAFDSTGQVRAPAALLQALRARHAALGGRRRAGRVAALRLAGGRVEVVLATGEVLAPDQVVVAGGVGSGALMRGLGHAAPVIAERGYHLEGRAGDWDNLPPVVFEDRSLIVTRFGDRLRAASFVEFAAPNSPPDPRKWARLRRHVRELGLPLLGELASWMGARPTLPDYLPAIGRSSTADNLIYAFGHQHLGLTLAPVTGELVAAIALGRAPAVPLAPFDLARFDRRRSRPPATTMANGRIAA